MDGICAPSVTWLRGASESAIFDPDFCGMLPMRNRFKALPGFCWCIAKI
jgi:hypothetical protein